MKICLLLSLTIFAVACSSLPKKRTDKLSILQGLTTEKEVEFNVLVPKSKSLSYELRSAEGIILKPEEVKVVNEPSSPWEIHKLLFIRDQAKEFNLYVYEKNKIIDQRLIGKGQIGESKVRLAVISCINDGYSKHFKIWDALANKNPEYVLMVGDNVYGNREATGSPIESNPENLWRRYTDMRLTVPFYFQQKLIPVHAVWDDNDYGSKDAGEEYEFKRQSKEIFDSFFAQSLSYESFTKSFGVGGKLSLGDFNLYFLDARYFRSHSTDGGHLGKDQHQWLVNSLKEESQPSFIIKGDQFFGGYHSFDSYEGRHPKDFENFVKDLKSIGTPVIFLSGDRHMSEIMQFPRSLFGLPSFEITSSPIHSRVYEDSEIKNPWRVVHTNGKMNFVYIENLAEDNHWFLDVENIGENGEVYFKRELAVYIKDLQNNLNQVRKRRHGRRRYHKHRSRLRKK